MGAKPCGMAVLSVCYEGNRSKQYESAVWLWIITLVATLEAVANKFRTHSTLVFETILLQPHGVLIC